MYCGMIGIWKTLFFQVSMDLPMRKWYRSFIGHGVSVVAMA